MIDRTMEQIGNYRIIRLIDRGGFAHVYLGEHNYLATQVAIKILNTTLTVDDRHNFLTEARTIAHLVHSHIVRVLDSAFITAFLSSSWITHPIVHYANNIPKGRGFHYTPLFLMSSK